MKYPLVLQHNEEDCGAACLASIVKYYGRILSINRIREFVGTGNTGTSLLGLKRGAEGIGFDAKAFKISPEYLFKQKQLPLPAIIHWQGDHWVVLYKRRRQKYIIADPAIGVRHLSAESLAEGWQDGVILVLQPDPVRFEAQPNERVEGLGRFTKRALPYSPIFLEALLCALAVGLLSLASPFLIQLLTDDVLVRQDMQLLTMVAIAAIVMKILSSGLKLVEYNLIAHFAQRLELGLVLDFGKTILRLPLTYYESRRSGEIVSRLHDIQQINQLVSQAIVSLPSQFSIALVSLSLMLFYDRRLTLVALAIAALMTTSTVSFLPTLRRQVREVLAMDSENQGVLVETFKGALTLKTTTAAPQFWEEFQTRFGRFANLSFRTIQIGISNYVFSELVSSVGSIALLWYGSTLVIGKHLSIGQLLAFSSMNGNFQSFISTVISFIDEWIRVQAATMRLSEVIDSPVETLQDAEKSVEYISSSADIICHQLNFHYPSRLDLLCDFSLRIPGGKVTALIGASGCGKSTVAKLIAGLYPLQSGNIRIDVYNLQDISLDCLRQQVVLVPQEAHFWKRSIIENFRMGCPYATLEQIVRTCQVTGADDFISKLPDKYRTTLGEFGANLSGGQRQRLAIARAIVNDPPILILDESTAGLDPVSEAQVLHQLLSHRQDKTTILISHRPRVINLADYIVYLDSGKLKMQGTPEELRSQPGEHLEFLNP